MGVGSSWVTKRGLSREHGHHSPGSVVLVLHQPQRVLKAMAEQREQACPVVVTFSSVPLARPLATVGGPYKAQGERE